MAIPKFEEDIEILSKLGDYPGSDNNLSTAGFKAKFDEAAVKFKNYINNVLIPNLDMIVDVRALLNGILDKTLKVADKAADAKATGEALSSKLDKAGGNMTGNIDMGKRKITNVADPTTDGDAVNKAFVEKRNTKDVSVTLLASGWSAAAPYTQSVAVEGLTDKLRAKAYPAWPEDAEAELALRDETVKVSSCRRSGSTMTFRCLEEKPELDIPVTVEVYV